MSIGLCCPFTAPVPRHRLGPTTVEHLRHLAEDADGCVPPRTSQLAYSCSELRIVAFQPGFPLNNDSKAIDPLEHVGRGVTVSPVRHGDSGRIGFEGQLYARRRVIELEPGAIFTDRDIAEDLTSTGHDPFPSRPRLEGRRTLLSTTVRNRQRFFLRFEHLFPGPPRPAAQENNVITHHMTLMGQAILSPRPGWPYQQDVRTQLDQRPAPWTRHDTNRPTSRTRASSAAALHMLPRTCALC